MNRAKTIRVNKNGIKKLVSGTVCVLLLCAAGPPVSTGTEPSRCEYKFLSGSAKGLAGESKIQISGNTLKWFVESPVPYLPKPKTSYIETRYKILERNKVGVVAASSDSRLVPNVGAVIVAQVLTIRKSDGALYVGAVGSTGVYELWAGRCK
jgi:hypothetical protein